MLHRALTPLLNTWRGSLAHPAAPQSAKHPTWRLVSGLLATLSCLAQPHIARAEEGVSLDAFYVADVLHNARGGLQTGTGYLDDFRLQLSVDTEPTFGLEGGTFFAFARAINSGDFATRYSGEFQKVSNIDASPAVRLYEVWYQQAFLQNRLSVRGGLYDLNTEFDVNPTAALFLNSAHGIGTDFGQTGRNGPSIYPVTSLAARVAWEDPSGVSLRFAIFDGVPGDPAHPKRTAIKLGNGDGALLASEAAYTWDGGKAALGAWHYTARFDDIISAASGGTRTRNDNQGVYGFVSNRLLGGDDGAPALDGYVRIGFAQPSINPIGTSISAGLVATGLVSGRPDDALGLSVGMARTGAATRRAAIISGATANKHETELELTYRAELSPWITVQPDVQLVIHPSFEPTVKNAVVVGLRFEISPFAFFQQ